MWNHQTNAFFLHYFFGIIAYYFLLNLCWTWPENDKNHQKLKRSFYLQEHVCFTWWFFLCWCCFLLIGMIAHCQQPLLFIVKKHSKFSWKSTLRKYLYLILNCIVGSVGSVNIVFVIQKEILIHAKKNWDTWSSACFLLCSTALWQQVRDIRISNRFCFTNSR